MTKSMAKSARSLAALGAMLVLLQGTPAQALFGQTFVSNTGSDANSCAFVSQACASFQQAHDQTSAGGKITVLNAGNYGPVTISRSIAIDNEGAGEATTVGVTINAGAGDVIGLRGLVFEGFTGGQRGIDVRSASAVHVQNCVVRNYQGFGTPYGIAFTPANNAQLFISDTIVYNNGTNTTTGGIWIAPTGSGTFKAVLDRVHVENNVVGLKVDGTLTASGNGARVVLRDSVVSGNASDGILALSAPLLAPAFILIEHSSSLNNSGVGIHANGPRATILLNDNTITQNGTGISAVNSGQLISYGNNKNNNNLGPEGAPTGFFSQM